MSRRIPVTLLDRAARRAADRRFDPLIDAAKNLHMKLSEALHKHAYGDQIKKLKGVDPNFIRMTTGYWLPVSAKFIKNGKERSREDWLFVCFGEAVPSPHAGGNVRNFPINSDDPDIEKLYAAWIDIQRLKKEKNEAVRQASLTLRSLATLPKITASWPEILPMLDPIITAEKDKPLVSVDSELNKMLDLPVKVKKATEVKKVTRTSKKKAVPLAEAV
jgi:hypothetical protein